MTEAFLATFLVVVSVLGGGPDCIGVGNFSHCCILVEGGFFIWLCLLCDICVRVIHVLTEICFILHQIDVADVIALPI